MNQFHSARRSWKSPKCAWTTGMVIGFMLALAMPAAADDSDEILRVTTTRFADVRVPIEQSAPAEAVALSRARVAARLNAPVASFMVEVGDRVDAGGVIARLECDDFEDRLEQAEGRLDELEARRTFALSRLERARSLREQGAASAETVDEAQSEVDSLTASIRAQRGTLREAGRDVERCNIRAPFDGVVTVRPISTGDWVQPGTELVRLLDTDRIELRARIPASRLDPDSNLHAAEFRADGDVYPVRHRETVAETDPDTRMREVRLGFTDQVPVSGTGGRLYWQQTADAIPAHLLVRREGELGVLLARDGRARFHVLPAAVEGRPAAAPGLNGDERLIIEGRHAAREGTAIRHDDDDS